MIKKGMNITYEVEGSLYINITNRCTNRCDFCIRNNGDGAYGSDSLWLEHEPSVDETVSSVLERDVMSYRELVFCGYGEPSMRLSDAREAALRIKQAFPEVSIRMNTNGHSDLILGRDSTELYRGAFDSVSVSLNAPSAEKYCDICHPVYGNSTLDGIITFVTNLKHKVPSVSFSVVRQTLSEDELSECFGIAERAGVPLRVRELI